MTDTREGPIRVLNECIELMQKKAADYNNPNSRIKQAMYYPDGIKTINDIIWAKMLRLRSLCESGSAPKNESLEDTYKDMINYCSFAAAWLRGEIDGQGDVDAFNDPRSGKAKLLIIEDDQPMVAFPQIEEKEKLTLQEEIDLFRGTFDQFWNSIPTSKEKNS